MKHRAAMLPLIIAAVWAWSCDDRSPGDGGQPGDPVCGDGACEGTETAASCPADCLSEPGRCGDAVCQDSESPATCPEDCDARGGRCGNGTCDPEENAQTCPNDCGTPPRLDDGCGPGDTREVCRLDEGADGAFQGPPGTLVGTAAAIVGDVDGDGLDDLLIGDPRDDTTGSYAGAAYLVYGRQSGWSDVGGVTDVDAVFVNGRGESRLGTAVAAAGDVNGDGLADLLIGAPGEISEQPEPGRLYLVPGRAARYQGVIDLEAGAPAGSVRFTDAQAAGSVGSYVSGAGDVDGDGLDDFLAVAPRCGDPGGLQRGAAYLVHGQPAWSEALVGLESAVAFVNDRPATEVISVAGAGDVDGDGFSDILIGNPGAGQPDAPPGWAYLVYGEPTRLTGDVPMSGLAVSFTTGRELTWSVGYDLAGAGDLDDDGLDDLVIAAQDDAVRTVHLYYGRGARFAGEHDLKDADAKLAGPSFSHNGPPLSTAGDVNADGHDDLLIAGEHYLTPDAPTEAVFLFLGGPLRLRGTHRFDDAAAVFLVPAEGDWSCQGWAGSVVAGGGDVNGDGPDDFVIGATGHCFGGDNAGFIYLVLGE